ncbi:hypothetical protein CC1G_02200 [Coprinopsis cinerea okayama7|uniref:Uncharacterized protein n=1 Tax=Coprinopsis cinerea (strain Okayama-7 / 130 / ATCC MYA-4618 / FGSC 9003) TaxID=240176 RepID=A8NKJ0_COPC7|nr:hypothetical protein CC1G_02200 [Coprinopsis cinerea okayama7\|eukprot:XP_001834464.2 hypothetical protein CC1G_02200 [Coprinopsis cinerea okayama7\
MSTPYQPLAPPESAALRALREDPNGGRCAVQNCVDGSPEPVVPCYVLPKEFEAHHELMTAFEYNFGYQHMSLNLDTRKNIFFRYAHKVSATLRDLFVQGKWALLPEQSVLERYYGESVQVHAVALVAEDQFPIASIRRYLTPSSDDSRSCSSYTTYTKFPFDDFPTITSHVHPNFAVYSLGYTSGVYTGTRTAIIWVWWRNIRAKGEVDFGYRSRRSLPGDVEDQAVLSDADSDATETQTEPCRVYQPPKRLTDNNDGGEDRYWDVARISESAQRRRSGRGESNDG